MSESNEKKNATERLEELEKSFSQLQSTTNQIIQIIQPLDAMGRDLAGLKEALKIVANKLDSVVKAYNAGEALTDDNINKYMVENNVSELTAKVTQMVASGLLVSTDTATNDSFVVINEADADGNVVNPRMQFLVSALNHEEVRNKLNGAKVGTNIPVGDRGASLNLLEAYTVVTPQAAATSVSESAAPADASADTTASDTASSTDATAATDTATADAATVSTDTSEASASA